MSRFGSLTTIQQTLTNGMVGAVIDGAMTLVTLAVMLVYSPALAAVTVLAVLLYGLARVARYTVMRDANAEQLVRVAKLESHFIESVRGVQVLKLFNREDDRVQRCMNLVVDSANSALVVQRQALSFHALNGALVAVEAAAVLYLGAKLVLAGQLSVGMLVAYLSYKTQFVSRVSALVNQALAFKMLGLQAERLADIVLAPPEASGNSAAAPEPSLLPAAPIVELRDVSFRYGDSEPWVLRNLSLRIDVGEAVAIAGPSGCGKTTLLKIMLGQLAPTEGEVLVGGQPLSRLGLRSYREMLGVVMQEDRLFAGSVTDNIAMFHAQVDRPRVEAAARVAAVHDDIARMPMGYHTLVGDMASALSGGQQQRLMLARALYKQPRILFLDEATSQLDTRTESLVNDAIQRLCVTRVIVAHRPQTLEAVARVGRVLELSAMQRAIAVKPAADAPP